MNNIFNQIELIQMVKSLCLGMIVGGIFGVFKIAPPSPNNILGVLGVVGLWLGWSIIHSYIK